MTPTRYHCGSMPTRTSPDHVWPLRCSPNGPTFAERAERREHQMALPLEVA